MDLALPSYDAVVEADANFNKHLDSCRQINRTKRELDKVMLKNRDDQRSMQMQIRRESEKMKDCCRKLKAFETKQAQLREQYMKLEEEFKIAEGM